MKEKPELGKFYKLPNPGLRAYFRRTVAGNKEDYRPPFYRGKPREEVLGMWLREMQALGVEAEYPELYKYELEMKDRVGPMSVQQPLKDRIKDVENYYTLIEKESDPISEEAIDETIRFFKRAGGIRMRSLRNTINEMRLSTNSGTPYFGRRKRYLEDTLRQGFSVDGQDSYTGTFINAATLGWRGQEGGIDPDDVKQRVLFMMPLMVNIKELQLYQPAVAAIQKHNLIPAYVSMEAVDQSVTKLFDTKGPDDDVICTDFTKFDQHFNRDMQSAARKIFQSLTTGCDEWFDSIYPIKFNIPIICSEDLMYRGPHGMGSGSGGTNFDECLAHKALQFEAAGLRKAKLNANSMAYGDDGILTYPGIKVEDVIRTYSSHGQEMNLTKQYVSKHDCIVLRRWHGTNYRVNGIMVGVYPTFRALGRLLAQERFYDPEKWGPKMVELRQLSIIENCKWSPYFHQFIEFVIKGDKFRLGLDIPGFLDNLEKEAQDAIETFGDFLGYTKTLQDKNPAKGINQWEVVKYVKSKR